MPWKRFDVNHIIPLPNGGSRVYSSKFLFPVWNIFLPSNSSSPYSKNDSRIRVFREKYAFSSHYQHSAPIAALFLLAYILIFLMCMTGNMLPGVTVLTNRQMWTVTNMFILNLAIRDLLVGTFCMPTTLVDNLITGKQGNEQ